MRWSPRSLAATPPTSCTSPQVAQTEQVRTFVAVELPDVQRLALAKFINSWRKPEDGVRWVPAENLHLTLRFLGNVPATEIEALSRTLEEVVASLFSFELCFGKPGAFPSRGAPRILWMGLEGDWETLRELHETIENAVTRLGFESAKERFSPHITLGRVRPNRRASLASVPALSETPAFAVHTASLMASNLTPQGAQYARLALLLLQQHQSETLS